MFWLMGGGGYMHNATFVIDKTVYTRSLQGNTHIWILHDAIETLYYNII